MLLFFSVGVEATMVVRLHRSRDLAPLSSSLPTLTGGLPRASGEEARAERARERGGEEAGQALGWIGEEPESPDSAGTEQQQASRSASLTARGAEKTGGAGHGLPRGARCGAARRRGDQAWARLRESGCECRGEQERKIVGIFWSFLVLLGCRIHQYDDYNSRTEGLRSSVGVHA